MKTEICTGRGGFAGECAGRAPAVKPPGGGFPRLRLVTAGSPRPAIPDHEARRSSDTPPIDLDPVEQGGVFDEYEPRTPQTRPPTRPDPASVRRSDTRPERALARPRRGSRTRVAASSFTGPSSWSARRSGGRRQCERSASSFPTTWRAADSRRSNAYPPRSRPVASPGKELIVRVATYTRISTDEEHQPYSLEAQATRLSAYAESQEEWQIVRRFSDQASGATLERPGARACAQGSDGEAVRSAARLPRRPPLAFGAGAGADPRPARQSRGAVSFGDGAVRYGVVGGADDGADARRVRRVRTREHRRARDRGDGTQSRPRRMERRLRPLRLPARRATTLPRPRPHRSPTRTRDLRAVRPTPPGSTIDRAALDRARLPHQERTSRSTRRPS